MVDLVSALNHDVVEASRLLLGCHLIRGNLRARIVETEAYRADEPACHAFRGQTERNAIMFGEPGRAYIYFSYGCHWMLNIVAHGPNDAAAILVRAAQPLQGLDEMRTRRPKAKREQDLLSGPGKLCAAFGIDRSDNGLDLLNPKSDLHLELGQAPKSILKGERIGISQAQDLLWRFADAEALPYVSKPHRGLR